MWHTAASTCILLMSQPAVSGDTLRRSTAESVSAFNAICRRLKRRNSRAKYCGSWETDAQAHYSWREKMVAGAEPPQRPKQDHNSTKQQTVARYTTCHHHSSWLLRTFEAKNNKKSQSNLWRAALPPFAPRSQIGYNGMPHIYPQNCPFSSTISILSNTPIHRPTPLTTPNVIQIQ